MQLIEDVQTFSSEDKEVVSILNQQDFGFHSVIRNTVLYDSDN